MVVSRLDDHSRNPLHARAFATVTMDDVQATFLQACAEHGIPARTLTDNGTVYTTRPISATPGRSERTLALMGVRHVLLQFFLSNFCTIFPQYGLPVSSRNCTI